MSENILLIGAMQKEIELFVEKISPNIDVLKTGIGSLNTALAIEGYLKSHHPKYVLNQGVVGALNKDIQFGDLIVIDQIYNGNSFRLKNNDAISRELVDWREGESIDSKQAPLFTNEDLNKKWHQLLSQATSQKIYSGAIISSDAWNENHQSILYFTTSYGVVCEDMESYAAAYVCKKHQIPFVSLKIVSNNNITGGEYNPNVSRILQEYILNALKSQK